ncbi:hypothetical protein K438DRAFT_1845640 [Mycena galopus ATCC 62051]|nr:hypothetical protein K438DRAFT_1845640 [Mycena galopus ATCC 62051]
MPPCCPRGPSRALRFWVLVLHPWIRSQLPRYHMNLRTMCACKDLNLAFDHLFYPHVFCPPGRPTECAQHILAGQIGRVL